MLWFFRWLLHGGFHVIVSWIWRDSCFWNNANCVVWLSRWCFQNHIQTVYLCSPSTSQTWFHETVSPFWCHSARAASAYRSFALLYSYWHNATLIVTDWSLTTVDYWKTAYPSNCWYHRFEWSKCFALLREYLRSVIELKLEWRETN